MFIVKYRFAHKNCQTKTLTHWGRVTHIYVSDLTSIGSDNGLSPGRRQAIIRTNAGILLIRPLGTNFNDFSRNSYIFIQESLKVSSAKRRPLCLGLNELKICSSYEPCEVQQRHCISKELSTSCLCALHYCDHIMILVHLLDLSTFRIGSLPLELT